MCGIAGLVSTDQEQNSRISSSILEDMCNRIQHRGPDDWGYFSWTPNRNSVLEKDPRRLPTGQVLLGHRRLSILDLSERGRQPMISADGQWVITYNGEVYNYRELREELKKFGYIFKTDTDTEVVLYAFAQWGIGALSRFVGMFAFAIVDCQNYKLFLVRDFFGIKPLYYTWNDGHLFFCSELKGLLPALSGPIKMNESIVASYLWSGAHDATKQTFVRDVLQLPAASLKWRTAAKLARAVGTNLNQRGLKYISASLAPKSILKQKVASKASQAGGHQALSLPFFDEYFAPESRPRAGRYALRQYLLEGLTKSSIPHLLRYEDRNTMAFSIESRVPFLTPGLVDFMYSLPEEFLIQNDGTTKWIFREAMKGVLPEEIRTRKDKIGFHAPLLPWLKALNPWMHDLFKQSEFRDLSWIQPEAFEIRWNGIIEGRITPDNADWRVVNLLKWSEIFIWRKPSHYGSRDEGH